MSQYITNFKSVDNIIEDYKAPEHALDGATVHLAWYGYGDYCGQSLVVFERDGHLFAVWGSHCSCYGLEGQWEPEETSWEELANYDLRGEHEGSQEAQEALMELVKKNIGRRFLAKDFEGRLIRE